MNAAVRRNAKSGEFVVEDIASHTDWLLPLQGCETVIHLAARVHVLTDRAVEPLEAFRSVNVQGTLNLARQAAASGIRRFVFVSSIGVNGVETYDVPFSENTIPAPHSPYALSKYEAEAELMKLASKTGIEVVVVRPPLVYGPNAPGNFGTLMRWLLRGVPLPLGAIGNQRSYVSLANLVDLIVTCAGHPAAANQLFLVSDGEDLSTTGLLRRLAQALGKPARLVPVPVEVLKFAASVVGKPELAQRLCGNLQVDISKARSLLGWKPPLPVDEGLQSAANGYPHETNF